MALFKGKRYKKCIQNEDGSIECVSYKPTRDGKKIPTATIKGQLTPECTFAVSDVDGDPEDIEELEEYLGKRTRIKCKRGTNL